MSDGDTLVAAVVQLVPLNDGRGMVQVHTVVRDVVDVVIQQHRWGVRSHVADLDALELVGAVPHVVDVIALEVSVPSGDVDGVPLNIIDLVAQQIDRGVAPHPGISLHGDAEIGVADHAVADGHPRAVGRDAVTARVRDHLAGVLDHRVADVVVLLRLIEQDAAPILGSLAGKDDGPRGGAHCDQPPALVHAQIAVRLELERHTPLDGQRDARWDDDVAGDGVGVAAGRDDRVFRQRTAVERVPVHRDREAIQPVADDKVVVRLPQQASVAPGRGRGVTHALRAAVDQNVAQWGATPVQRHLRARDREIPPAVGADGEARAGYLAVQFWDALGDVLSDPIPLTRCHHAGQRVNAGVHLRHRELVRCDTDDILIIPAREIGIVQNALDDLGGQPVRLPDGVIGVHKGAVVIPRDENEAAIGGAVVEKVVVPLADPQRALVVIQHCLDREPAHPLAHIGHRFRLGAECCIGAVVERVGQPDDVGIIVRLLVVLLEVVGAVAVGVGAAIVQIGPVEAAIEIAVIVSRKVRLQKVVIHLLDVQVIALQAIVEVKRHKAGIRGGQAHALEQIVGQRFAPQAVAHQVDPLPILELVLVAELDAVGAGPDVACGLPPIAHADVVE